MIFFIFFGKNTPNIISKLNDNFSENFFEVLHISVGQKLKILETCPDCLTFLKSSSFELQKRFMPQNNPRKNRHSILK